MFAQVLKVQSTIGNNKIPSGQTTCGSGITFSASDISVGFANSDLHIFVTYVTDSTSQYLALASACSLNVNLRPNTGMITFNAA
jgi:hypothetical protein